MELLNKLQKVTGVDFSGLKKFKNKITLILKINSDNKKVEINGPVIILPINGVSNKEQLQTILRETIGLEHIPILQEETQKLVEDFKQIDSGEESQEVVAFFKGKIPANDIEALRQSVYVKAVKDRGGDIEKLKLDIINRYGTRGRNICNLYSAGYFKSQIRPLYEEMVQQPDFSPADFEVIYNRIVNESPYAVFISREMTNESAEKEVRSRIEIDKNYGIRYLNIHGIGEDNVDKIIYILDKLRSEFSFPEEVKRQGNVITVKIQF